MRDDGWMDSHVQRPLRGEGGWVETGDSGRIEFPPGHLRAEQRTYTEAGTSAVSHVQNFLESIKTRRPAHSNAKVVAKSHIICHAAYIACNWDVR